jgi:hypothetical protein
MITKFERYNENNQQTMKYDSREDTMRHINRVAELLGGAADELIRRGENHDASKLENPEKEYFDQYTPKLGHSSYGTEEYNGFLKDLKVALNHHYASNSHHPEHYPEGINDFDLFDLMEMFFDWKASSERHEDGNIYRSIDINKDRFKMSEQIVKIFQNTAKNLGY